MATKQQQEIDGLINAGIAAVAKAVKEGRVEYLRHVPTDECEGTPTHEVCQQGCGEMLCECEHGDGSGWHACEED